MHTMPIRPADLIALHREMFGDFTMMADDAGADGAAQPTDASADDTQPSVEDPIDWKVEARKWEDRSKANKAAADANKAAADKLARLEEANKTEAQKQADKLTKLEAELAEYKTREQVAAWTKEVADAEGVPGDLLRGSTREELEAHAKQLKPLITAAPKAQPVPGIGQVPDVRNVPLKDQIAAAEKAGDKSLVASLKAMQLASVPASS